MQPATKEAVKAPTERELADRAERNPGRNWRAHQAKDTHQALHDQQTVLPQPTVLSGTNGGIVSGHHNNQQASTRQSPQPSKSWLLVAVLVIVIAGLVMLSLSL